MNLYRNESSNPKYNAQHNLSGRTHYVDDHTLRFHKSRILLARHTNNGLLFAIVESVALDIHNTKRGFRYVIFDLFGDTLGRMDLEHCFKSSKAATDAMWLALNAIDAKEITRQGIDRAANQHIAEIAQLTKQVQAMV